MISAEDTIAGLQDALSLRQRIRSLVQLFGAGAVVALVVVLWLTESDLPTRTRLGFAAIVIAGLLIMTRAARLLRRRGRLFAKDRVIASWIASGFAVLLAAGLAVAGHPWLGVPAVLATVAFLLTTYRSRKRLEHR